jgi:hypothetical protein
LGQLLTDEGAALLHHPTGRLLDAFRVADASCSNWRPRAAIRLYASPTDEQAAFPNSRSCQAALAAPGVRVSIVGVGDTDHLSSNALATAEITRWFSAMAAQPAR